MSLKIINSQLDDSHLFEDSKMQLEHFGKMERYFLTMAYPRKLVFNLIGLIWSIYFLWNQDWVSSLAVYVSFDVLGFYFSRKIDLELMSETTLGKIGLMHMHPINITFNVIGIVFLINGIWNHYFLTNLVGISLVILGHFFGWSKVHENLRIF